MSTKSDSSSLLHVAQRNRSKSTVSSSDTDLDSAGYASSSGTTTPEDDTQTFHLGPTGFRNVLIDKHKCTGRDKLTIVARHRSFSSAMKKVKQVAHALATFKRKRPDDISPILISSPLRERFGKRMSVKPQPDESFYSLPNRRFSLSDVRMPLHHLQSTRRKFGTISGSSSSFARGAPRRQRSGPRIPSFSNPPHGTLPSPTQETVGPQAQHNGLPFRTILVHVLHIILFVPWCAAVGGALLLFPNHVERVAFQTGYIESRKGIRRFAHWVHCGQQHVMIFLACLVAAFWHDLRFGLSLTSIVVSRFVFVWRAFEVDKSIPLGEDDQQSLYLIIMGLASTDSSPCVSGTRGGQVVAEVDGAESMSAVVEPMA